MRVLIAGAGLALAKAFIKEYKKEHELVALDPTKSDFSDYTPIREIFKAYAFDAVLYFTAEGRIGDPVCAGELGLFKNLRYAAALHRVPKMITVTDADETALFNAAAPRITAKDPFGVCLKLFGLFGKGVGVKISPIMRLLSDANKTGVVRITRDRRISAVHIDDAVRAIGAFLQKGAPVGVYDVAPYQTTFVGLARSAKRLLNGGVTVEVLQKDPAPELVGDAKSLAAAVKMKFIPLNAALEKVLGNV